MTTNINDIILSMYDFQRENNIKQRCMTNCQTLYDIIKDSECEIKTKEGNIAVIEPMAIIAFIEDEEKETLQISPHMVLKIDNDELLEASYEFSGKNVKYLSTIQKFLNATKLLKMDKDFVKEIIRQHTGFCKIAERMKNGEFIITDNEYYKNQMTHLIKNSGCFIDNLC